MCLLSADIDIEFPDADDRVTVTRPAWLPSKRKRSDPETDLNMQVVDSRVGSLLADIREISAITTKEIQAWSWTEHTDMLTWLFATLQKLLSVPILEDGSDLSRVSTACVQAVTIHILGQWCPTMMVSLSRYTLIFAVKPVLRNSDYRNMLLWIVSVLGTGHDVDEMIKWWSINQLTDITEDLEIDSWRDLSKIMGQMPWNAERDSDSHHQLWQHVKDLREARAISES
jgi:hypothetical protein